MSDEGGTLTILVATDNHLGYNEKDPIRGNDSFDAFEEILKYARDLKVDMMVLGGDLFHDNKPSRKTIHTSMELLRHYCFGEKACELEFLSDPSANFHSRFGTVNYQDPNYNVSLPVFMIHGNHDDPAGDGNLSALDLLSTAGLVNYFGKAREVDDITCSPIILRKGETKLALYGIGNIRDERLHRTFTSGKVKMLRPPIPDPENWFNLMLFHQNRAAHSPTNHIPETFLDDFLDLIIWGHEHDCQIDPLYFPQKDFYVSQPGSSCITSLSEGEAKSKHIALLTVKGSQFKLEALPLKSSRPFVFADLVLASLGIECTDLKAVNKVICDRVESMLVEAGRMNSDKLPLIRLRIDYSGGFNGLNPQRFGQLFTDRVANPRDMITLVRKRQQKSLSKPHITPNELSENIEQPRRVDDLVSEILGIQKLELLPQNEFSDVVKIFVEKDDKDAIEAFVKASLLRTIESITNNSNQHTESLREEIERVKVTREEEWKRLNPSGEALINHRTIRFERAETLSDSSDRENTENTQMTQTTQGTQASQMVRGRGRGRGSTAGPSRLVAATKTPKRPAPLHLEPTQDKVILETPTKSSLKKSRWPSKN